MFGTTPIISDTPTPTSTALFLPIYNGPEEDGLIGFVQEHDLDFEAFDTGKAPLGRFANIKTAMETIWADCLGERPRPGQLRAATAAAIAAYETSGQMLDAALAWAAHGFPIFPVTVDKRPVPARNRDANGKPIPGTGGFKKATTNLLQIRGWWKHHEHLIGLPTGAASGVCCIDVDTSEDHADGVAEWNKLITQHEPIVTREHRSATGGPHLIFNFDWPTGCSSGQLPKGIEVKGQGGYIVVPPSRRKGRAYTVHHDIDPGPLPLWLRDLITAKNNSKRATNGGQLDPERARATVAARADDAPRTDEELHQLLEATRIEGEWHSNMLLVTASLIGRGYPDSRIKLICAPYFNDGFTDQDFADLLDGARKKWGKPNDEAEATSHIDAEVARLAMLSPLDYERQRKAAADKLDMRRTVLDELVGACRTRDQEEDVEEEIAELNADYALVLAGNKAAVMKFDDPTRFRLLQVSAFKTWFSNQLVMIGKKAAPLGDYWVGHPQRRQYAGIEFVPPGSPSHPGFYNLWQGFAVKPREGDCSKFLAHVKDNIARGDEATYLWIVGWWAQIYQQPSIKMETALVLRGPFGVGKTKIGETFGSLIDEHYLSVSRSGHITGQFNSHMASLLVLHADEAFWAGDKAAVGTLNDLVSGKDHLLEYKGVDKIRIKNHIRLFVSGNPDWLVPAGFKERRWAIFDVGEEHMQDHAYFAAIDHEMNNGGREALLHYLLNFELSQVNLRVIPKTAALLEQQIQSMTPEQAWWLETLRRGVLPPRPLGLNEPGVVCLKDNLFERYVLHARVQGVTHRSTETKLGLFLHKQLGAKVKDIRPFAAGGQRPYCFEMPPLQDCRRLFSEQLGQPVDWGEEWANEDWQQGYNNWPWTSGAFHL